MIAELFGERECGTHQPGDALSQGAVQPFNLIRLAGQLGDGPVLGGGYDPRVDYIVVPPRLAQSLSIH